jgi:hypothetical protein
LEKVAKRFQNIDIILKKWPKDSKISALIGKKWPKDSKISTFIGKVAKKFNLKVQNIYIKIHLKP